MLYNLIVLMEVNLIVSGLYKEISFLSARVIDIFKIFKTLYVFLTLEIILINTASLHLKFMIRIFFDQAKLWGWDTHDLVNVLLKMCFLLYKLPSLENLAWG